MAAAGRPVTVYCAGFVINPADPWLGVSPDGMTLEDGRPFLKRSHNYYLQVQGQLGICGLDWCDFVMYTSKSISIERIQFDEENWANMCNELLDFYIQHFAPVMKNL